jgi:6-phosphogluconolactonase
LNAGSAQARTKGGKDKDKDLVYVGTYTGHGSKGIYGYRFDAATGQLTSLGLAAESEQPAFLAADPSRKFLYASNEMDQYKDQATGAVSAFAIDQATGKLSLLNEVSAQAPGPAHVRVDRTGKDVVVTNYPLGSVTVLPVLDDGRLGEASDFVRHQGSSVNPQRQQGPHAHSVALSPDNRFAIVADLGLDQVIVYPFDAVKGKLGAPHAVKVHPGSGPRHLTFAPNGKFLYLLNEMGSTVTAFAYEPAGGNLTELQTISTLPEAFSGESTAAEIQVLPSGKFIYASNRGDDSIAVFAVAHAKGTLNFVQRVPTQGKTPRNFAIDPSGSWLLAANQNSNDIVTFRINQKTGQLAPTGQVLQLNSPVCIEFVPLP